MNSAQQKAYAVCLAEFKALNESEGNCASEAEYKAAKQANAAKRAAIHARIDSIRAKSHRRPASWSTN